MHIKHHYHTKNTKKQWSSEDIDFLKQHYLIRDRFWLAKHLNRTYHAIGSKLRNMGLNPAFSQRIQTKVNHDFFKQWSEHMGYILGYWFADGYMSQLPNHYFSISSKDKSHLKRILKSMDSEHKIKHSGKGTYRFSIGSQTIWNDVHDLGGVPAKSLIAKPPKIPKPYIQHFIRGYFDGDGCICNSKRGLILDFSGTHEILTFINDNLPIRMGLSRSKAYQKIDKNHWRSKCQGKSALTNCQYLYYGCNIYLPRKKTIFDHFNT